MSNTNQGICGLLNPHLMADRTPGLLGRNDAADPSFNVCLAGDTPEPVGTNGDKSAVNGPLKPKLTLHTLALSLTGLTRFFRSVATAVAMDKLTVVKGGVNLPDSGTGPFMTVSKAIVLAIAPEKSVETASPEALKSEVSKLVSEYTQQLLKTMDGGVPMLLFNLEQKKLAAVNSMNKKFEDAQAYNNEKVNGIKELLRDLIAIKFASTVFVKTASNFVPIWGLAIDLGFDVVVKSIDKTAQSKSEPDADVLQIIDDTAEDVLKDKGKEVGSEFVVEKVAEKLLDVKVLKAELSKLERQMREQRLSAKKLRNKPKNIARTKGALDKATSKVKWAGRGVGFLFWMKDMNEAWETLQKDLDSLE